MTLQIPSLKHSSISRGATAAAIQIAVGLVAICLLGCPQSQCIGYNRQPVSARVADVIRQSNGRLEFENNAQIKSDAIVYVRFENAKLALEVFRHLDEIEFPLALTFMNCQMPQHWLGQLKTANVKELYLIGAQTTFDRGNAALMKNWGAMTVLVIEDPAFSDKEMTFAGKLNQLQRIKISGTSVGDVGIAELQEATELVRLDLSSTRVTDNAASVLARLSSLQYLDLSRTQFTDEGVAQLSRLTQLHSLSLSHTLMTDRSMIYLRHLPSLVVLDCSHTRVSLRGLANFSAHKQLSSIYCDGLGFSQNEAQALLPRVSVRCAE